MKIVLSLTLSFFLAMSSLIGQTMKPSEMVKENGKSFTEFNPLEASTSRKALPQELQDYKVFSLNQKTIAKLLSEESSALEMNLSTSSRSDLKIQVVEIKLPVFEVTEAPSGNKIKYQDGRHYRGIIKGQDKSLVSLSVYQNELMAIISPERGKGNYVLGKLDDNTTDHILYWDEEINGKKSFACGTDDTFEPYEKEELFHQQGVRALSDCVGLYFEIDYDIFQNKGSNTTTVTNFITGLYNQVATMYANENINTNISDIVIWTQTSPYSSSSSSGMLNQFTSYRQGFNGDLAMLLSYQASGGIAYVNGLCSSNPDYSMSFSSIDPTYQTVPTYSWSVMVVTHEFGHLFGSQHTHACVWNGNGTAIDGCYTTEGGCPNPGVPSNGGTVMSYCHLTSAGINLNNGFGPQPGNLIRSRVTNASCLSACSGGGGGGGGGTSCTENEGTLTINLDNYPGETTWSLTNSSNATLYSGGPYSTVGGNVTADFCLPDGCYTFTINDSYGDGICCGYGNGDYSITFAGTVVASGGQFASTESTNFCLGNNNPPTCTDGVQNGNETGIDCGGPDCAPCISCNDGIQNGGETGVDCGGPDCNPCTSCNDGVQNGNETGVDCGGPDCNACPTCNDGVQNGNETGVDCGGPDCSPCGTGGSNILSAHFFESGWDGWIDGGSDCYRYYGSRSYEGNYSIRIRDNSGTPSSMTSQQYDLSGYDAVEIEFYFYAYSMENGEDFWVQYNDGSSWQTVAAYARGTSFNNNTYYVATVTVNGATNNLSSNARFRFRCDASSNADQIYIDAVTITGINGAGLIRDSQPRLINEIRQEDMTTNFRVYPNPATEILNISVEDEEEIDSDVRTIELFNIQGQRMIIQSVNGEQTKYNLDVSTLNSGLYILKLTTIDGDEMVDKVQIIR